MELLSRAWWGILLGIFAVGLLSSTPQSWVAALLGKPGTCSGIARAMLTGLFLDLCNHGVLLVGMRLYQKGASLGQVFAFLIASPWNSLSLTLLLAALIGWKWTLLFILGSALIAFLTGIFIEKLTRANKIPANPYQEALPQDFSFTKEIQAAWEKRSFSLTAVFSLLKNAILESRMILRWIFFGIVLTCLLRSLVDPSMLRSWVGPGIAGLFTTLVATTLIEVCSEGSSPIASDLLTLAHAPGNAFAFLMAGASTDYTEIMALKETTKSWKLAFLLPLTTLPQIILLSILFNHLP